MSTFYRLYWNPRLGADGVRVGRITDQPRHRLAWRAGEPFTEEPGQPIVCKVALDHAMRLPAAFLSERIPLFSDELVEVLSESGVDNLELFRAHLVDEAGTLVSQEYSAVNIVGKIEAANMAESDFDERSAAPMLEFRRLVIDEGRVGSIQMFRLAENPSYIVISEQVARGIISADLLNVSAVPLP